MRSHILVAATAVVSSLPAQIDHFTSSPNGYEAVEGALADNVIGGNAALRLQQCDSSFEPEGSIDRLAFRRDGLLPDNSGYGARNLELEIVMSDSDLSALSTTFDANYTGNTATVVARTTVSFPDWTLQPVLAPSTNVLQIDFDSLWTPGTADLLWEVRVYSNDGAGSDYPMDADSGIPQFIQSSRTSVGLGCRATGQFFRAANITWINNWGTKLSMDLGVGTSAKNSPTVALLDAVRTQIPGGSLLCTALEVNPAALNLPLGVTDAGGNLTVTIDPIPYSSAFEGATLVTQMASLDPGQSATIPVAFSQGAVNVISDPPPATAPVKQLWAADATATTATSGILDGGIILQVNHP
ncbi:MAG: hypothetical protein AAF628_12850 [Planctomycetota bacterium]